MPRTVKPKHYQYWCIARTGGAFAIVDFANMQWCYMYRDEVKANKKNIKFSEKKETYMQPFFSWMDNGHFVAPSTYFVKGAKPNYEYSHRFQMRNSITNRSEDFWVVPYDIFLASCGEDPDITSLLVLYGEEVLYDKIILAFINNRYISNWNIWSPLV